jgi:hypothetical protein
MIKPDDRSPPNVEGSHVPGVLLTDRVAHQTGCGTGSPGGRFLFQPSLRYSTPMQAGRRLSHIGLPRASAIIDLLLIALVGPSLSRQLTRCRSANRISVFLNDHNWHSVAEPEHSVASMALALRVTGAPRTNPIVGRPLLSEHTGSPL